MSEDKELERLEEIEKQVDVIDAKIDLIMEKLTKGLSKEQLAELERRKKLLESSGGRRKVCFITPPSNEE